MKPSVQLRIASVLLGSLIAGVSSLQAAWVLQDDFDALTLGDVGGQNGWVSSLNGNMTVAVDPNDAGNQVLQIIAGGSANSGINSAYKALSTPMANGATSTLFSRFRVDALASSNASFGLSDSATPNITSSFTDFEVQGVAVSGDIRVRDAGSFVTVDQTASFNSDVWYNSWMVVDNQNDTWEWYVLGGSFLTQTLLTTGQDVNFRNGTAANAMQTIYLKAGISPTSSALWFDDMYLDTTGSNLASPFGVEAQFLLPEPSSLGLLGLAALLLRRGLRKRV